MRCIRNMTGAALVSFTLVLSMSGGAAHAEKKGNTPEQIRKCAKERADCKAGCDKLIDIDDNVSNCKKKCDSDVSDALCLQYRVDPGLVFQPGTDNTHAVKPPAATAPPRVQNLDAGSKEPARAARAPSARAPRRAVPSGTPVCCKRGRHYFMTTPDQCRGEGGYFPGRQVHCRKDEDRVCCKKGSRSRWTTWRACRHADGDGVPPVNCTRSPAFQDSIYGNRLAATGTRLLPQTAGLPPASGRGQSALHMIRAHRATRGAGPAAAADGFDSWRCKSPPPSRPVPTDQFFPGCCFKNGPYWKETMMINCKGGRPPSFQFPPSDFSRDTPAAVPGPAGASPPSFLR